MLPEEEYDICEGCKWNKYPLCSGTIMEDGAFMNIENLRPSFSCGVKDSLTVVDHTPKIGITIEALEASIIDLESRLSTLEER